MYIYRFLGGLPPPRHTGLGPLKRQTCCTAAHHKLLPDSKMHHRHPWPSLLERPWHPFETLSVRGAGAIVWTVAGHHNAAREASQFSPTRLGEAGEAHCHTRTCCSESGGGGGGGGCAVASI